MTMLARVTLALIVALSPLEPGIAADSPRPRIELHPIEGASRIAFATKFFYKHYPQEVNWSFAAQRHAQENWTRVVRDEGYFAQIDLGDDGATVLILVIDDPNWCNPLGCLSAIFRATPKGYEYICGASLPGAGQLGAEILVERENGYHRLATPARIIEWNANQKFDSGTMCSEENREP